VAGAEHFVQNVIGVMHNAHATQDRITALMREATRRQEEREAQRALALRVIDVGYRAVARDLHPDKGGSPEAMTRLNAVRARLKHCV
jgi:hypothetical protein